MSSAVIIALEPGDEPLLIRSLLEAQGVDVQLRRIGKPSAVMTAFNFNGGSTDLAVIAGHGDKEGFIMPEMARGIDSLDLVGNRLRATDLAGTDVDASTVISTACGTGTDAFAAAFLAAGAVWYIAPEDYPDGAAIAPILSGLIHSVFGRARSWPDAVAAANTLVAPDNRFRLWRKT
ncbi:hypothetical protein [Pelagibacterium sp.]|uniref:hypothetical protein n=1 Tax=Pelagibacterium sp. TaxID=1967288 RepID=UPI003A9524A2